MIEVEAPDGTIIEFPDGTDDDTINWVMRENYESNAPGSTHKQGFHVQNEFAGQFNSPQNNLNEFDSAVLGLANGILLNYGSEGVGVLEGAKSLLTGGSFTEGFEQGRSDANRLLSQAEAENPASFTAGEIGGSIATTLVPGSVALKAAKGATKLKQATTLAGGGAAQGAVFGAGEDESREESAKTGAIIGGTLGFLAPALGRITGTLYNKLLRRNQNGVPASSQLNAAAQKLYQEAEDSGIFLKESSLKGMIQRLGKDARALGSARGLNEAPMRTLALALEDTVGPQSIRQFEGVRQRLTKLARTTTQPAEKEIANELIRKFDRLSQNLSARDLAPGATNIDDAVLTLRDARAIWRRKAKTELVEDIIRESREAVADKIGGVGFERQLRNRFKSIKNAKNKKLWNSFDKQEKSAINKLIRFGVTDLTLEGMKVLIPSGQLGTLISGGGGFVAGGIPGAIALVAGSKAARLGVNTALKSRATTKSDRLLGLTSGVPIEETSDPTIQLLTRRGLIGMGRTNE